MPNGCCKLHGGKTPSGIASALTITGRHSRALPARLAAAYQQSLADPEQLAMRREMALCDSRIEDLLGRVDTGEAGALWRKAREALESLEVAEADEDGAATARARRELHGLLGRGVADYAAWGEIATQLELRRKLADTERKRLEAAQTSISADKAMLLMGAVLDAVRRAAGHVTDPRERRLMLQAVQDDVTALTELKPGHRGLPS